MICAGVGGQGGEWGGGGGGKKEGGGVGVVCAGGELSSKWEMKYCRCHVPVAISNSVIYVELKKKKKIERTDENKTSSKHVKR